MLVKWSFFVYIKNKNKNAYSDSPQRTAHNCLIVVVVQFSMLVINDIIQFVLFLRCFFILFDEKMMMYWTLRGYLHNTNMKTFSLKISGSSDDEKLLTIKECMEKTHKLTILSVYGYQMVGSYNSFFNFLIANIIL